MKTIKFCNVNGNIYTLNDYDFVNDTEKVNEIFGYYKVMISGIIDKVFENFGVFDNTEEYVRDIEKTFAEFERRYSIGALETVKKSNCGIIRDLYGKCIACVIDETIGKFAIIKDELKNGGGILNIGNVIDMFNEKWYDIYNEYLFRNCSICKIIRMFEK